MCVSASVLGLSLFGQVCSPSGRGAPSSCIFCLGAVEVEVAATDVAALSGPLFCSFSSLFCQTAAATAPLPFAVLPSNFFSSSVSCLLNPTSAYLCSFDC